MLRRKMLRDIRSSFAQFFSIMLLSLIAMWCYTGFQANVIGGNKARVDFESDSNFADGWIYGADFSEEQAKKLFNRFQEIFKDSIGDIKPLAPKQTAKQEEEFLESLPKIKI